MNEKEADAHPQQQQTSYTDSKNFLKVRLARNLTQFPDKVAYRWLDEQGEENDSLTYRELIVRAMNLANHMKNKWKILPTGKVLLVFVPSLDFIVAFLACLLGKFVAMPVYPPDPGNPELGLAKIQSVARATGVKTVLTHSTFNRARKLVIGASKFPKQFAWFDINAHAQTQARVQAQSNASAGNSSQDIDSEYLTQKVLSALPDANLDDVAFIQFTSGSTGDPKGVMISHGNLYANLWSLEVAMNTTSEDIGVSWVPSYHDMGLIGNIMLSMYTGGSCVFLSPVSFIKHPIAWLHAITKFRATMTGAPNFAYDLCVSKVPESKKQLLDLSSCKRYTSGGEPVRAGTLRRFSEAFKQCGFRDEYWDPTYGSAENTLLLSTCQPPHVPLVVNTLPATSFVPGEPVCLQNLHNGDNNTYGPCHSMNLGNPNSVELVGNGIPGPGTTIAVVHPETCELLDIANGNPRALAASEESTVLQDEYPIVGELWATGPSKATGYYGNDALSRETFQAELRMSASSPLSSFPSPCPASATWYRTGDMGFLYRGHIFICGRIKDMLVCNGRNVFPQDLELSVETSTRQIRSGCVAVFSAPEQCSFDVNEGECIVVVAEMRTEAGGLFRTAKTASEKELKAVADTIHKQVARDHGLSLKAVCIIKPKTIPKTSSGKIRRSETKRQYCESELQVLYHFKPQWQENKVPISGRKKNGRTQDVPKHVVVEDEDTDSTSMDQLAMKDVELPYHPTDYNGKDNGNDNENDKEDDKGSRSENKILDSKVKEPEPDKKQIELDTPAYILQLVRQVMDNNQLQPDQDLFEAGMTSLQLIELSGALEKNMNAECKLPSDFMAKHRTTTQIAEGIQQLEASDNGYHTAAPAIKLDKLPEINSLQLQSLGVRYIIQAVGIFFQFVVVMVAVLPAYHFGSWLRDPEILIGKPWSHVELSSNVYTFGILSPLVIPIWMFAYSIAIVLLKWLLIGKYQVGIVSLDSVAFLKWWFIDRLLAMWEFTVGRYVLHTPLLNFFYILQGADISMDTKLKTFLHETDLVEIGPHSSVKGTIMTRSFDAKQRTLRFRRIQIGKYCNVGSDAVIQLGSKVPDMVKIDPLTVVSEGSILEHQARYRGNPARNISQDYRSGSRSQGKTHNIPHWILELITRFLWMLSVLYTFYAVALPLSWIWKKHLQGWTFRYSQLLFWFYISNCTTLIMCFIAVFWKWVLLGKRKPGKINPTLWLRFREFAVDYSFRSVYLVMLVFESTAVQNYYLRLFGAPLSLDAFCVNLTLMLPPSVCDFVRIGCDTSVSKLQFEVEDESNQLQPISIGDHCFTGLASVIGQGVTMADFSSLGSKTYVAENETIPSGIIRAYELDIPVHAGSQNTPRGTNDETNSCYNLWKSLVQRLLFLVSVWICLIPGFELAWYLLFGELQTDRMNSVEVVRDSPLGPNLAILLVSTSFLVTLVCFGIFHRIVALLALGTSRKQDHLPCSRVTYFTYQNTCFVMQNLLLPAAQSTIFMNMYVRWMGARIHDNHVVIHSQGLREHQLLEFHKGSIVDTCHVLGHQADHNGFRIKNACVGKYSLIQPSAAVLSGGEVPSFTVLDSNLVANTVEHSSIEDFTGCSNPYITQV